MITRQDLEQAIKRAFLEAEGIRLAKQAMHKEGKSLHITSIGETTHYSPNINFDLRGINIEGRKKTQAYADPVSLALFRAIREFEEQYGKQPNRTDVVLLNIWNPEYNPQAREIIKKGLQKRGEGDLAIQLPDLRRSPQTSDFLALEMLRAIYPNSALVMGWKTAESGDFLSTKIINPTDKPPGIPMLELIAQTYHYSRAPSPLAPILAETFASYYQLFTGRYDLKEERVFFEQA